MCEGVGIWMPNAFCCICMYSVNKIYLNQSIDLGFLNRHSPSNVFILYCESWAYMMSDCVGFFYLATSNKY